MLVVCETCEGFEEPDDVPCSCGLHLYLCEECQQPHTNYVCVECLVVYTVAVVVSCYIRVVGLNVQVL